MTAPWIGSEEAQDEKAGEDVRVPGNHRNYDGVWGLPDGFGGRMPRRYPGPEQLLRRGWRLNAGSQQFELGPDLFSFGVPHHGVRVQQGLPRSLEFERRLDVEHELPEL